MLEVTQLCYNKWHHPNLPKLEDFVKQYRKLYQDVARLFDEFNVCGIRNGSCRSGDFCCHGCQYLDETGCRTDSIWCKLWICRAAGEHLEDNELFWNLKKEFQDEADELCLPRGGRYGLTQYILNFYGPTEYEKWRATQTNTTNTSST